MAGKSNPEMALELVALAAQILNDNKDTKSIERVLSPVLDARLGGKVDTSVSKFEANLNTYFSAIKKGLKEHADALKGAPKAEAPAGGKPGMVTASIVTPEDAKKPSACVTEVAASVDAPAVWEGDGEATGLYEGRETKRGPSEILPENSHTEMRKITLASTLSPSFTGSYMGTFKLSREEADLLEGLN